MFVPCWKRVRPSSWADGDIQLTGNSDGNIRYFEYENDKFEFLSEYKSADPQRGIAFLPKRGLSIHENEVMRAFKTVNDSYIEPISFIVPRRAEVFQGDIYPPVPGSKPGMTAAEWFDGKDDLPPKLDLESVYSGEAPIEVPANYKPSAPLTPMPPSEAKNSQPVKETPQPTPTLQSPPSIKEQGASMLTIASKFVDQEESESEDDSSSFEEVPQPTAKAVASQQTNSAPAVETSKEAPEPIPSTVSAPKPAEMWKVGTSISYPHSFQI